MKIQTHNAKSKTDMFLAIDPSFLAINECEPISMGFDFTTYGMGVFSRPSCIYKVANVEMNRCGASGKDVGYIYHNLSTIEC